MLGFILLAEGTDWSMFLPWILIFVLGYMLLIRPAMRQERERKAMIAALKENDRVIAAGGIIGKVARIKENEDEVTLKVDDGRIRVLRSSIVKVLGAEEPAEKGKEQT